MRKPTITINERDLMFVVAGQLYDQAPNREPRQSSLIMYKVREAFRKVAANDNEWYTISIEDKDVYNWIKELLFSIEEFRQLNLTQDEYDAGLRDPDSEERAKYKIVTAYDKKDKNSWRSDFIDLDAFVRNVCNKLYFIQSFDQDCFLCIHQPKNSSTLSPGDSEICNKCSINPNLTMNYKSSRKPRGKYTFACKYDCIYGKYICCEECDKREKCKYKCDSNSETCGNKVLE